MIRPARPALTAWMACRRGRFAAGSRASGMAGLIRMMRRGIATMLLLAVLALLSCAPSSTHAKVPGSFWGVSLTDSKQLNDTDFDRMKSGRVAEVHWTV